MRTSKHVITSDFSFHNKGLSNNHRGLAPPLRGTVLVLVVPYGMMNNYYSLERDEAEGTHHGFLQKCGTSSLEP